MVFIGVLLSIGLIIYKKTRIAGIALLVFFVLEGPYYYFDIAHWLSIVMDTLRILSIGVSFILLGRYVKNA